MGSCTVLQLESEHFSYLYSGESTRNFLHNMVSPYTLFQLVSDKTEKTHRSIYLISLPSTILLHTQGMDDHPEDIIQEDTRQNNLIVKFKQSQAIKIQFTQSLCKKKHTQHHFSKSQITQLGLDRKKFIFIFPWSTKNFKQRFFTGTNEVSGL